LTNKIKINSWLRTGDLGYFDKNGFLYIKDRLDNMTIVSGENIYPSEIENHLYGLKQIKIGVVSSVTDDITQNKLIFIYEAKKKIKYEYFYNFFKSKISKFKIPKQIYHVNELGLKEIPKAPNKKILRSKLKKYLEETLNT
jgi:acyl-CoA synthetase (AMP-forming)/AMP-acid ligase II